MSNLVARPADFTFPADQLSPAEKLINLRSTLSSVVSMLGGARSVLPRANVYNVVEAVGPFWQALRGLADNPANVEEGRDTAREAAGIVGQAGEIIAEGGDVSAHLATIDALVIRISARTSSAEPEKPPTLTRAQEEAAAEAERRRLAALPSDWLGELRERVAGLALDNPLAQWINDQAFWIKAVAIAVPVGVVVLLGAWAIGQASEAAKVAGISRAKP